jgi:hypothetical protein
VGADARCSNCGETIRLPGKLETVAAIHRIRRNDRTGLALEILGFVTMLFLFPWGLFAGAAIVYFGWRKSTVLVCSNCHSVVADQQQEKCTGCRSKFGSD